MDNTDESIMQSINNKIKEDYSNTSSSKIMTELDREMLSIKKMELEQSFKMAEKEMALREAYFELEKEKFFSSLKS